MTSAVIHINRTQGKEALKKKPKLITALILPPIPTNAEKKELYVLAHIAVFC